MEKESWYLVIVLGIFSVILFAMIYAGIHKNDYILGVCPGKYAYFTAAVLAALVSFILYIYIFYKDTGDHTGNKMNAYYIVTLLGIFLVSWLAFSSKPGFNQFLGMFIVIVGLVIFSKT